jgi:cytochrome b
VTAAAARIRVWDLPTRIFHWTLVALVVFSFTTGKLGGSVMAWHVKSGYAILSLLVFRLAWGLVGGQTSRFATFVRGPRAFLAHAGAIVSRSARAATGHNPMGGWMVVFLLMALLAQAGSGLFSDDEIATTGPLVEKVSNAVVARMSSFHYYNGWMIAVAAGIHVMAVAFYQLTLRIDVIRPMVFGWREGDPSQPPMRMGSPLLAAGVFAIACGAVYWLVVIYPKG